jgi:hypothetical protein
LPTAHLASARVERQVAEAEDFVVSTRRGPPQQGAHPSEELLEGERLHEVVVGTGVEAVDSLSDRSPGREHEHWRPVTGSTKSPAHFETVQARHRDIEHYGVSGTLGVRRQAGHPVFGQLGRETLETQRTL